jgi:hypothetical protein
MNARVSSRNVLEYAPRGYPPMNNNYHRPDSWQKWMVWVGGLCGNGEVVGPLFFPGNVSGEAYLDMLNNNVVPIWSQHYEVQANGAFRRVWWAQDGAPAHRRIIVRDRLQELFRNRVIAFGQPREWPPRSPDLTPCDFFCGGISNHACIKHLHRIWRTSATESLQKCIHCRGTWFAEPC